MRKILCVAAFCAPLLLTGNLPSVYAQNTRYRDGGLIYDADVDEVEWETIDQSLRMKSHDALPIVALIQHLLRAHAVPVKPDGDFGPQTEAAIKQFQRGHNLKADGIVGPKTWARLVIPVKHGSHGEAVRALQVGLTDCYKVGLPELGKISNDPSYPDGVFGSKTEQVVRELQKEGNARLKDGTFAPIMWRYLISSLCNSPGN